MTALNVKPNLSTNPSKSKGHPCQKKTLEMLARFLIHGESCKYSAWNQPNAKNDMLGFNQILEDHQMVKAKLSILAMKSDKLVRIESELRQLTIVFCVVVIDALFKWRHERKCAGIVSFFHISHIMPFEIQDT